MIGRFTPVHLSYVKERFDERKEALIGLSVLVPIIILMLMEWVRFSHLAALLLVVPLVMSFRFHKAFPLGDMTMVLFLSRDMPTVSERAMRFLMQRTIVCTVVSSLAMACLLMLDGWSLSLEPGCVAILIALVFISNLLVLLRWMAVIRFGRRNGDRVILLFIAMAVVLLLLEGTIDWSVFVALLVSAVIVMWLTAELMRAVWLPSKQRMLEGI